MGAMDIRLRGIAKHSPRDTVYYRSDDGEVRSTRVKRLRVEFVDNREFSLYYVTEHGVFPASKLHYTAEDAGGGL